jgi:hypothetical protein
MSSSDSKPTMRPALASSTVSSTAALDPFDLASLRLNPSFLESAGVKKMITTVPVRRPNPQDFIRVHDSPRHRDNFAVVDLKEDREDYLVRPEIIPELANEIVYKTIFTAINRQGICFLWPVRYPSPDDRRNDWARSAREAAELAMTRWVRMKANRDLGAYEIFEAESVMVDPIWPELSFQQLIKIAFRDRIIADTNHAVIRRLRGLP